MVNMTLPLGLFLALILFAGAWLQLIFANSDLQETPRIRLTPRGDIIGWGGCFSTGLLITLYSAWVFASWAGIVLITGIGGGLLLMTCGASVKDRTLCLRLVLWAGAFLSWVSGILIPLELMRGQSSPQIRFSLEEKGAAWKAMLHLVTEIPGFPTSLPAVCLALLGGGIGGMILLSLIRASSPWRTQASLGLLLFSLLGAFLFILAPVSFWHIQPGVPGFLLASFLTLMTAEMTIVPRLLIRPKTAIRFGECILPVYRRRQIKKRMTLRIEGVHQPLRVGILQHDQVFSPFTQLAFSTLQAQAYIEDLKDPIGFFSESASAPSKTGNLVSFPTVDEAISYLKQLPTSLERFSPEVLEETSRADLTRSSRGSKKQSHA